jgi:hypothetical protein
MNHTAIRALYPNVVLIDEGTGVFDKDGKKVIIDEAAVEAKALEMWAEEDAKKQASLDKLKKLGLTADDLKNILG